MSGPDLLLLSRLGCHLCDEARSVVAAGAAEVGMAWRETDVDTDPALRAEWGDLVPVVLLDGRCLGYYRIEPEQLAAALHGRA